MIPNMYTIKELLMMIEDKELRTEIEWQIEKLDRRLETLEEENSRIKILQDEIDELRSYNEYLEDAVDHAYIEYLEEA